MNSENVKLTRSSYIYDVLHSLGITSSTENKIKDMMDYSIPYKYVKIYNKPFNGKMYNKSYVYLPIDNINQLEMWFDGNYIYGENCKILGKIGDLSVILLDQKYDESLSIRYWINLNVVDKKSYSSNGHEPTSITVDYDKTEGINESSIYAIADNDFVVPVSVLQTDDGYHAKFVYRNNLEVFVCKNLSFRGRVDQNKTIMIGNIDDPLICGRYILNIINRPLLDVRFYPYIRSLEPGFLRVFSDISINIEPNHIPYVRFMCYPENIVIKDPYDSRYWSNANMTFSQEVIKPNDSEEVIFSKLEELSKEYYKTYRLIGTRNKLIESFDNVFSTKEMTIDGIIHRVHLSSLPYNPSSDILYYNGSVFMDYNIGTIRDINSKYAEQNKLNGFERLYILDDSSSLNVNEFSIMKFNSDNNTTIKNIAYYMQENINGEYDYIINFNKNIQKMYRNLLVIKDYDFDFQETDKVILNTGESLSYPNHPLLEVINIEDSEENLPEEVFDGNILTGMHLNDPTIPDNEIPIGDVFAEWVESLDYAKNLYRDDEIFICELNDSIVKIELSKDNLEDTLDIFIFEDIMLNFRKGSKVLSYNGILPDLLNSRLIDESDLLIFDGILYDSRRTGYLKLENYPYPHNNITNSSFQVNPDMSIIHSKNIKRCSLYRETMNIVQLNELNSKIINLNQYPIYFDKSEFIVFINGKYMRKSDISVIGDNRFIVNFIDEIYRVDVLYSSLDEGIFKIKNIISK